MPTQVYHRNGKKWKERVSRMNELLSIERAKNAVLQTTIEKSVYGCCTPCDSYIKLLSEKSRLEGLCTGLTEGNTINLKRLERQDKQLHELLAENEALQQKCNHSDDLVERADALAKAVAGIEPTMLYKRNPQDYIHITDCEKMNAVALAAMAYQKIRQASADCKPTDHFSK